MKRIFVLGLCALLCIAMASKPKPPAPPPAPAAPDAQIAANKKLVLDMAQMLFVDHKVDEAIDTYFDPGYIQHNPMAPDGSEAIRTLFKGFYKADPQATYVVKRILCEGDLCAIHSNSKANPSDRGTAVVDIFRIANGKIVEHWDVLQPVPEKSANDNTMF